MADEKFYPNTFAHVTEEGRFGDPNRYWTLTTDSDLNQLYATADSDEPYDWGNETQGYFHINTVYKVFTRSGDAFKFKAEEIQDYPDEPERHREVGVDGTWNSGTATTNLYIISQFISFLGNSVGTKGGKASGNWNIPIFKQGDTESIEKYIETGDDSGALNYDYLHTSPADYYLTNNGDRITLKYTYSNPSADSPRFDYTDITFHSDSIGSLDFPMLMDSDEESITWTSLLGFMKDILPTETITKLYVTVQPKKNNVPQATLTATIGRKFLGLGDIHASVLIGENNGYTLTATTDNSFDDVSTPSQDQSNATGNSGSGSSFGGFSNLVSTYKVSKQALQDIGSYIWQNDGFKDIKLFNNSPIENIVSLHYMPCDIDGQQDNITLGNVSLNVTGVRTNQNMIKKTVAQFTLPIVNTGFLAFEPYTTVTLYLCLVGAVELKPTDVCGYTVTIEYVFDVVVGSFGVMVYTSKGGGKTLIFSTQGQCSVDIPLMASNKAQIQASMLQSGVSLVGDVLSSNVGGAVSDTMGIALQQTHTTQFGSPSSMVGALSPYRCFYVIRTTITNQPSTFAHTKGWICKQSYRLSNLKGFTKLDNDIDVQGGFSQRGNEQLKAILTSGFYI